MKKILQVLLCLFFVTQLSFAQWHLLTLGKDYYGIYYTDSNNGTVCGENGTILRTTDGGTWWVTQSSGTTSTLYKVVFTDPDNGIIVGENGTILRTTNSGITWAPRSSGTTNLLYNLSFADVNNGTAVGENGTILRTTDGGVSWIPQSSGTSALLCSVFFTDANNGIVVGQSGLILKTTNGGTIWTEETSGVSNTLCGVFFTDANNGTAVGFTGTILKTTDSGITWTPESSGTTDTLISVFFTDSNNGTIVGWDGVILKTTNGGSSWGSQTSGTTSDLSGVFFTDANNGTITGSGIILTTTNGGLNWTSKRYYTTSILYKVIFTDSDNGITVGGDGTILRTTDGGVSWIPQSSGTSALLCSVFFTDANNGIVVGQSGLILKTTNGGTIWTEETSGVSNTLCGVFFTDANNGTAVGFTGTILKTTDSGITWTPESSGTTDTLISVFFTDSNNGTIVGWDGVILKTTNGGSSWGSQTSGTTSDLSGVFFTDANNGTITGDNGIILNTTNGGESWAFQTSGTTVDLYGVFFTDSINGTIVGNSGTILNTTNSGDSWVLQTSETTDNLYDILFTDDGKGIVVGDNGTILINEGELSQFTEQTSISLPGVSIGSVDWVDYDNDGDLDLLLTGTSDTDPISKIYQNTAGTFSEIFSGSLDPVTSSDADCGDYNNDGNIDILLTGIGGGSKIYQNTGAGFSEVFPGSIVGIYDGVLAWGDYDNDGDLDIVLAGGDNHSKIYQNTGSGFSEVYPGALVNVYQGAVAWGDYNNDGKLDILLTGWDGNISSSISKIYRNTGSGFTEVFTGSLPGVHNASIDWGDYDNDGDLDILISGDGIAKIYQNTGSGFIEVFGGSLSGFYMGSADWGDYDNDGDLDILLTGNGGYSKIYQNTGSGFNEVFEGSLPGVNYSKAAWGDYDNDGALDIILTGQDINGDRLTKIYRNNNTIANTIPAAPTNLTSLVNRNNVTFSWNKSIDNETPQNGLQYNLVVGTSPNAMDIVSPMSDRSTGYRRVVSMGNTNQDTIWTIKGLAPGKYYWSVQTIDNAFAGSNFASEQSFLISTPINDFTANLSVTDNCSNQLNLTIGTEADATDGFDAAYDQYAPPIPPGESFDARLRFNSEDYLKDFRRTNLDSNVVWNVIYQPAESCGPVTLNWDASQFPSTGFFLLVDPVTGGALVNVNMKATNTYTDNLGLGSLQIVFKYSIYSTTFDMNILSGWNILGLPLEVEDAHYLTLFSNAINGTLYGFNSAYYAIDTLKNCMGYWLKFPGAETVTITGKSFPFLQEISLNSGWNLISGLSCDIPIINIDDPGGIIIPGTLYRFDGAYYSSSEITQGHGYWIKANAAGDIILNCLSSSMAKSNREMKKIESSLGDFNKINITDGSGKSINLYFSGRLKDSVSIESYSLPPMAPSEAFDARFNGGYRLIEADEGTIKIQSNNYPVKLKINGNGKLSKTEGYLVQELSAGKEISSRTLKEEEELLVNDSKVTTLIIKKGEVIPTQYSLEQNYPNPFNPTTTIKFGLPEAAQVHIKVYNMLGEQVTELINQEMEAGYHKVQFNASNYASGVYFYRIEAGKFNSVKKMIILK